VIKLPLRGKPQLIPNIRVVRDSFPTIALFRCSRQLNPDLWGTLGQFIPGTRSKPARCCLLVLTLTLGSGFNRLHFDSWWPGERKTTVLG
ncbi:hypothetical protein, partial [Buttiauxella izardii]|uniref:hypothetical protein n=1 Tax=Buttiauxella izardii TaxID=82991 RepID=UPI001ABFF481